MRSFHFLARGIAGLTLAAGLLLHAVPARAQATSDAPGSPGPRPGAPPATVPIDGGASLLLASGVAYGLRKLRQRRAR
ncbi:hypothetical protein I2I05_09650 [Hymenobacter sp. BT683]|uniref:VPDSG-CTERM sorting domain-containing protein n=1 Tax=Hymenobacter jeongseonensis TaxID=2791027 RepID=A0ABS0IH23_9BACT|nr:hypothetical protein [Hymenobacter jeongseonensis]MBF9237658.1 hypothetical protein [Hymenobacter jeongseonensis]